MINKSSQRKQRKFLYFFTTENFDVTTRPVEYPECRPMINRVEKQFEQLMRLTRELPNYLYIFALLHHFKEFEKAVWVMPKGGRVKVITIEISVGIHTRHPLD